MPSFSCRPRPPQSMCPWHCVTRKSNSQKSQLRECSNLSRKGFICSNTCSKPLLKCVFIRTVELASTILWLSRSCIVLESYLRTSNAAWYCMQGKNSYLMSLPALIFEVCPPCWWWAWHAPCIPIFPWGKSLYRHKLAGAVPLGWTVWGTQGGDCLSYGFLWHPHPQGWSKGQGWGSVGVGGRGMLANVPPPAERESNMNAGWYFQLC